MEEVKKVLENTLLAHKTKNKARQKRKIEAAANSQKNMNKKTKEHVTSSHLTSTVTITPFTIQYYTFNNLMILYLTIKCLALTLSLQKHNMF